MRTPEQNREHVRRWRAANPDRAREHQRRWRAKNRDALNAKARLRPDRRRRRALGVDEAEFQRLFVGQGRACAVCRTTTARKWTLDHNHETGQRRGILCNKCNLGIGLLNDNPDVCRRAASYLIAHRLL